MSGEKEIWGAALSYLDVRSGLWKISEKTNNASLFPLSKQSPHLCMKHVEEKATQEVFIC